MYETNTDASSQGRERVTNRKSSVNTF